MTPPKHSTKYGPIRLAVALVLFAGAGCGSGSDDDQASETAAPSLSSTTATPTTAVGDAETVNGVFAVGTDGHRLAMRCYGEGSPAVVLEPGTDSAGLEDFRTEFIRLFAADHQTCVYDRAGTSTASHCQTQACAAMTRSLRTEPSTTSPPISMHS